MGCFHSTRSAPVERKTTGDKDVGLVMKTKRRMKNVFNEHLENTDGYVAPVFPKSSAIHQLLNQTLTQHVIFSCLNDEEKRVLIDAMEEYRVKAGEDVIREGDEGDYFYIVERGNFSFIIDGKEVGQAHDGSCFGELALMYNTPRAATVHALTNASLWRLDRLTFRILLAQNSAQQKQSIISALSKVQLLQGLTNSQIELVAEAVQIVKFGQGRQIIEKDTEGNIFYMIIEGEVLCTNVGKGNKYADVVFGPGDYFGERALLLKEPRAADVFAQTDVTLMALDRESFNQLLGPLSEVLDHNLGLRVIKSIEIFQNLSDKEREQVVKMLTLRSFQSGKKIIQQGKSGHSFYIIKKGTCKVTKDNNEVATLSNGDYFGEMSLLNDEPRAANVTAVTDVEVFELERQNFNSVVGSMEAIIKRDAFDRNEALQKASLRTDIQFNELKELAILGAGTFGRVTLVKYRKTGQVYALKAMIKSEIIRSQQQKNVVNEKNIMLSMNHPFILKLITTFRDPGRVYLLLEFIQGGELFSVIHTETRDGVSALDSKFYGASVLSALKHMHEKNISYRDLKPENILIDAQGYCRVADFGFAKILPGSQKTYTLCGTPEYLAPEIITQRGYSKIVDIWAFGILCYEMIAGFSPFVDFHNNDQMVLFRNIMGGRLSFPKRFDPVCADYVQKILVRDPLLRLGSSKNGFNDLMEHQWFQGIDWAALLNKELRAPWLPTLKSEIDSSHFNTSGVEAVKYAPEINEKWDQEF